MKRPWECHHVFRFAWAYIAQGFQRIRVFRCVRCGLTRIDG